MQNIRQEIDRVDTRLLKLLKKRADLVKNIGQFKKVNGLPIKDSQREQQILDGILKQVGSDAMLSKLAKKIWRLIFEYSYKLE